MEKTASGILKAAGWTFSLYYLLTGIWPLADIKSFMMITGPKNDWWLVRTVGVLIIPVGAGMLFSVLRKKIAAEILLVGIIAAAGLCAIDCYYVAARIISKIYLMDAAAQLMFLMVFIPFFIKKLRD